MIREEKVEHCIIRVNWLERLLMRMLKQVKKEKNRNGGDIKWEKQ